MTENEKKFVKSVVEFEEDCLIAQNYIREEFGVDSSFDRETSSIVLEGSDNLSKATARQYLLETLGEDKVQVFF